MKQMHLTKLAIAGSTVACAALFSFSWSEQRGVSLSVESAQARVGRPLTPMSVAGVARRQDRRAAYRYGAGVVGAGVAGAAAVGTAAAVVATSPNWGWGGGPDYTGEARAANAYYAGVHSRLQQWLVHNARPAWPAHRGLWSQAPTACRSAARKTQAKAGEAGIDFGASACQRRYGTLI